MRLKPTDVRPNMNFDQARYNMIEQQIRTWEVLDQRVLDAIARVRREDFVPEVYRRLAFADIQIPIGHGEVMMAPSVEARMIQSLQIQPGDRILEIGTGSGYVTAVLAALGAWVTSVEIHPDLSATAGQRLQHTGVENVTLPIGDAMDWRTSAVYDAVAVTGSLPVLTPVFQSHVGPGGRLFAITGEAPVMEALLLTRIGEDGWARESLFETRLPALVGARRPENFVL
ncbi:MAG: protein-L-isoaspartate O-methyltransferase family protein [Chromatiales bacterium]